ncbi:MAG: HEAT repeat domain-containing protein [Spirochaetes bacterium]|jgi:HEAT repeat protein|nr:HEAT repeat domain-containing protein [Spirochaetota bacterium]
MRTSVKLLALNALLLLLSFPALEGEAGRWPTFDDLESGSYEEKITAMYFYGYSRNKRAFWYMVKNLDAETGSERGRELGERVRTSAAESLGRLGDERAVPFLVERYRVEKSDPVRKSILSALGRFKGAGISQTVSDGLLSGNTDVQNEALVTAAMIGDRGLVPQIRAITVKEGDSRTKYSICFALVKLGDDPEKNSGLFRSGLKEKDPSTRFWCAYYLSMTDRTELISDIIAAVEIENQEWVKKQMETAIYALSEIKKKREKDL